ncbi:MAG: class I SAM-dependent methyltransferase [Bacteroidia bacterium]|nr:class I SAM-dependent methyltransferase [Bacteroidia bacterium]
MPNFSTILSLLTSTYAKNWIEENLAEDPARAALRAEGDPQMRAALATQLKYLQKAQKKLPAWFEARCLIPAVPFEQCSGQVAALLKPTQKGGRLLDLTCGLGVDSWAHSFHFQEVISLEPDPERAAYARYNFELLGRKNITVINSTAEAYLAESREPFDFILADPSRRDESGRKFLLEDCQPDVLVLQNRMLELATAILLKVSPLFDLEEGFRLLPQTTRAEVVSVDGEVKEVLFHLQREQTNLHEISVTVSRKGEVFRLTTPRDAVPSAEMLLHQKPAFIPEPDPAFYKAGLVPALQARLKEHCPTNLNHPQGYLFSAEIPPNFPGRVFAIQEVHSYKPAQLKKLFREKGLKKAWIMRRDFDLTVKNLYTALNLKEGGNQTLLFTRDAQGERWLYFVKVVN